MREEGLGRRNGLKLFRGQLVTGPGDYVPAYTARGNAPPLSALVLNRRSVWHLFGEVAGWLRLPGGRPLRAFPATPDFTESQV